MSLFNRRKSKGVLFTGGVDCSGKSSATTQMVLPCYYFEQDTFEVVVLDVHMEKWGRNILKRKRYYYYA